MNIDRLEQYKIFLNALSKKKFKSVEILISLIPIEVFKDINTPIKALDAISNHFGLDEVQITYITSSPLSTVSSTKQAITQRVNNVIHNKVTQDEMVESIMLSGLTQPSLN